MLDDDIKQQLTAYLERVKEPFEMVASLDDGDKSTELRELLEEIAAARPDKITLRTDGSDARKPSFTLARPGSGTQLRFAAIPMGHEFTSLILA
ncbi:MAG: alkyl hydroperoxide reductase subunit F, partial [Ottowia sp.]|nr:alkyl hydroperoxide reductase subunit F [Ottowia sp.]